MREALDKGPLIAVFTVYNDFTIYGQNPSRYPGGIYHHAAGGRISEHAVELIGYGWFGDQAYWLVN